jgi:hypothetical protein
MGRLAEGSAARIRHRLSRLRLDARPVRAVSPRRGLSRVATALGTLIGLGLAWRYFSYVAGAPLWGDEAFVAVNIVERGFLGLLRPLEFFQIAPPGFLWVVRACTGLLGPNEWALRLGPFLAGLASLLLFWRFAVGEASRRGTLLAVGIFAASFYPVRHACEVKPYAVDLLMSLVATRLAWAVWLDQENARKWAGLGLFLGVGVWVSYPLVFVAGGAGMILMLGVIRRPSRIAWEGWGTVAVVTGLSWGLMYLSFARGQSAAAPFYSELKTWKGAFPPWSEPWRLPLWLVEVHAGNMMAYPAGGNGFASLGTLLLVIRGAVALAKRKPALLALLLAPLLPTLAAASLRLYPYGTSARISLGMAPAFCFLAGVGASTLVGRLVRPRRRYFTAMGLAGALGIAIVVSATVDVALPYKNFEDLENRRAARALALLAKPGETWLLHDGIDAWPDDKGLMLEHWLQQVAEVRYNLEATAPGPFVRLGPTTPAIPPGSGRIWLIVHRSGFPGFSEAELQARLTDLGTRFGEARLYQFPLTRGESIDAFEFYQAKSSPRP